MRPKTRSGRRVPRRGDREGAIFFGWFAASIAYLALFFWLIFPRFFSGSEVAFWLLGIAPPTLGLSMVILSWILPEVRPLHFLVYGIGLTVVLVFGVFIWDKFEDGSTVPTNTREELEALSKSLEEDSPLFLASGLRSQRAARREWRQVMESDPQGGTLCAEVLDADDSAGYERFFRTSVVARAGHRSPATDYLLAAYGVSELDDHKFTTSVAIVSARRFWEVVVEECRRAF